MNFNLSNFRVSDEEKENSSAAYRHLYDEARRLVGLEVENARLMLTEKLTLLLGRVTLVAVCFVISACVLIFLSMSISDLLLGSFTPWATYMIVAGFYALLICIVALFRRQLIVDPIARYLSKVLLDPRPSSKRETESEPQTTDDKK
ncbi:MAG: phage holin family protein [Muribaculaceae bacterium]|nr:phage holin family protein [Muribaculaceae bacterium]